MADYAHPETLVSTDWVAQHNNDSTVRIVEVDVDTNAYQEGHVPGAIGWAWNTQLCDTLRRDILSKHQFEKLMADSGISNDTTVILYGHNDVRIMDGGRKKWLAEGREVATEVPAPAAANYKANGPDNSLRAFLDQ